MTRFLLTMGCAVIFSGAAMGAADTWSNVPLVDTMCSTKVKDHPDAHTKACALQCATGGFGIIAADGTFLKLDDEGNAKAVAALKAATTSDHVRVTLAGERKGDTIEVASLRLQ